MSSVDETLDQVLDSILQQDAPLEHPSAEQLILHARGDMPEAESHRLVLHLATCAPCRALRLELPEFEDSEVARDLAPLPDWVRMGDTKAEPANRSVRGRPKILIVEDDVPMAGLLRRVLEKAGFQVEEAHRGERALECLDQNDVSLMLLDYRLPDMTGADVISNLGARVSTLPVVMVTGFPSPEIIGHMTSSGVDDYLIKDTEMDFLRRLPAVVDSTLHSYLSDSSHPVII